jgi:hypothetical protein
MTASAMAWGPRCLSRPGMVALMWLTAAADFAINRLTGDRRMHFEVSLEAARLEGSCPRPH